MSLFYLTLDRYSKYKPDEPVSEKNPGGGMGPKTLSVIDVWQGFYDVSVAQELHGNAEILVVEPLWFLLRGGAGDLATPDIDKSIEEYKNYPARVKVVYTSELAFLKLRKSHREEIMKASTVVTTNCHFQKMLFEMFNVPTMPLCDVIDPINYYRPKQKKRLAVMAMGRISIDKNSQKIVEIFKALSGKIERVYFGGAGLWGYSQAEDTFIESELKAHCDTFFNNVPQYEVSNELIGVAMGIFDPFHDCASTSNLQSLMAGLYNFYGLHGLWTERPGHHNLRTVSDFVEAIEASTDGFKSLPSSQFRKESESWALEHTSPDCFLNEWQDIIRYANN